MPKGSKKVETSESEMEREKEREKVNTEIDDSDESQEELDEKGEEKVMIPVEKLTIPEELCKMKSTGREDKVPEEKEEKTVISKPSALARVFKRKGSKKGDETKRKTKSTHRH